MGLVGEQVEDTDRAEGPHQAGFSTLARWAPGTRSEPVGHPRLPVMAGQPPSMPTAPSLLTLSLAAISLSHAGQHSRAEPCLTAFGCLQKHIAVAQETPYGRHRRRGDQGLPVGPVWVAAGKMRGRSVQRHGKRMMYRGDSV